MKYLYLTLITLSLLFAYSWAHACEYKKEFEDCQAKNEAWITAAASDYLCVSSSKDEEILYNLILDKRFSEVDTDAYAFLRWITDSKDYFFGEDAQASYFQWVEIINLKFWNNGEYWKRYKDFCTASGEDSVIRETFSCLSSMAEAEVVRSSSDTIREYLEETNCMGMAEAKLRIYELVAYDTLKINKAVVRKDNRKKFMKKQRTKYGDVLNLMRINLGYMERIWKKWPSKTKDAL